MIRVSEIVHITAKGFSCDDGDVRLVGGNNYGGRVEYCRSNSFGRICDSDGLWDAAEAKVVCNQLGFKGICNMVLDLFVCVCVCVCLHVYVCLCVCYHINGNIIHLHAHRKAVCRINCRTIIQDFAQGGT